MSKWLNFWGTTSSQDPYWGKVTGALPLDPLGDFRSSNALFLTPAESVTTTGPPTVSQVYDIIWSVTVMTAEFGFTCRQHKTYIREIIAKSIALLFILSVANDIGILLSAKYRYCYCNKLTFFTARRHASAVLGVVILSVSSVRLQSASVCLSVTRVHCD